MHEGNHEALEEAMFKNAGLFADVVEASEKALVRYDHESFVDLNDALTALREALDGS